MKRTVDRLFEKTALIIPIFLLGIFLMPASLQAGNTGMAVSGKTQKLQDPERINKALYALLQKAQAQRKIINEWNLKRHLEQTKIQAKDRKQRTDVITAEASRRACQIQLAMARTPADITIPGCRPAPKAR